MEEKTALELRKLPRVDDLLAHDRLTQAATGSSPALVKQATRETLDALRRDIIGIGMPAPSVDAVVDLVLERLGVLERPSLATVINATGVVIHTNLGRSVLAEEAARQVYEVARAYSTLEFDVEHGVRGSRHAHVEGLLCQLTGAEAACVVNNNAAAVMLVISELAKGKKALVSRGELIEIGGSFRIPDIMDLSGAQMVEVGTTNKTHLADYEHAFDERTSLVLKVHPSNYRIVGFTEAPSAEELVAFAHERGAYVYEDQGSGVLFDLSAYGLPYERTVQDALKAGVDIVSCSGDKLLGGAQAGLVFGSRELIGRIKKNPFMRALRPDKLTLAGLEITLRLSLDESRATAHIPTLRMLTRPYRDLAQEANAFAARLAQAFSEKGVALAQVDTVDDTSRAGGGALPAVDLPTRLVTVACDALMSASELQERLLHHPSGCIVTRVVKDRVCLDVRTVLTQDEKDRIVAALVAVLQGAAGTPQTT